MSTMLKTFLKVKPAAEYFSVGRDAIYKAIHNGELKAYKPNCRDFLVKVSEVQEWIESKAYHD